MHTVYLFTAPGEEAVSVGAFLHGSEPARGEAVQQRASWADGVTRDVCLAVGGVSVSRSPFRHGSGSPTVCSAV